MDKKGKKIQTKKTEESKTVKKNKLIQNKIYIGYTSRVIIYLVLFFSTLLASIFIFKNSFSVEEVENVVYQENGSIDYKVSLKPNEFYDTNFLDKNMYYIASLIENIDTDINYKFTIEEPVSGEISYEIVGKLVINGQEDSKLYEKEYILKEKQKKTIKGQNIVDIIDKVVIDYSYYNNIANNFKSTYGIEVNSDYSVYVRINKNLSNDAEDIKINENSEMNLSMPLTQKTLNVQINDTGINTSRVITKEDKTTPGNIFSIIISLILFVCSVALILKALEMLFLLIPKKSKYDIYVNKILNEYDRLIVETPSEPRFNDKEIIKINKFNELLDARDNLKRPIMYYSLVKHEKCYFYIEKENTIYLLVLKAVDLELEKNK